jgi:deazaflavin-dependent oxidoreductase (nitroreductase family)
MTDVTQPTRTGLVKTFEMTAVLRVGNRIVTWLLTLGIPVGRMSLLTVQGRSTRLPRTTPVALTPDADGWLLVAAYGRVDWVRNLQKAKEATITQRGRSIAVNSSELAPAYAAPILRDLVATAGPITLRVVRPYFATSIDAPVGAWEAESINHPVFRLTPMRRELA